MKTKQVIVLLKFSNLRTGKYCSQAAHASLGAFLNCSSQMESNSLAEQYMNQWLYDNFTKIVLYVRTVEELITLYQNVMKAEIPCALIADNGTTEFNGVSTVTALGIGPWLSEEIDVFTKDLDLF